MVLSHVTDYDYISGDVAHAKHLLKVALSQAQPRFYLAAVGDKIWVGPGDEAILKVLCTYHA